MKNKLMILLLLLLAMPIMVTALSNATIFNITGSTYTSYFEKSIIQTDEGNVYAISGNFNINLTKSKDGGLTWSSYVISTNGGGVYTRPVMIYDSNQKVLHIIFESSGSADNEISYVGWNLTTDTKINEISLFTATATTGIPSNTYYGITQLNNGTLGIVYPREDGQATPKQDIKFKSCNNICWNLTSWSAETILADSSTLGNTLQQDSSIITNGSNFYVTWHGGNATYISNNSFMFIMRNETGSWGSMEYVSPDITKQVSYPAGMFILNHVHSGALYIDNVPIIIGRRSTASREGMYISVRNGSNWSNWIDTGYNTSKTNSFAKLNNGTFILTYDDATLGDSYWLLSYDLTDWIPVWYNQTLISPNAYNSLSYQYNEENNFKDLMYVDANQVYLFENNYPFIYDNTSLTASVLGTTNTSYYLNLTYETTDVVNISGIDNVYFYWNGTQYNSTLDDSNASRSNYSTSIVLPFLATTTVSTFWTYNVTLTNGINWTVNTSVLNQTILSVNLSNTTGTKTLNFTIKDENTNTSIISDLQVTFQVWYTNFSRALNFSYSLTGKNNYQFYINPVGYNFFTNAIIRYNSSNYTTRYYYLDHAIINGVSQDIILWNIRTDNSSNIYITLYDDNDNPLPNYQVKALKYFVGTNSYDTVEITNTDANGNGLLHLIPYDVLYKFIVQKDGVTYLETSPAKIISTTLTLRLPSQNNWFDQFNRLMSIQYTDITYDNATQTFSWTYNDVNNLIQRGCLKVIKRSTTADSQMCETCSSSTAATVQCVVPGTMAGYYLANGYIDTNTNYSSYSLVTRDLDLSNSWHYYGLLGVLLSWLIICTLALAGGSSPVGVIIMTLLGLLVVSLFGLTFIGQSMLWLMIILGGILLFKMKN